jgi:2Fe-2S ferredoxin
MSDAIKVLTVVFESQDGTERSVETSSCTTLMQVAVDNSIPGIEGQCGGNCVCATCHVYVGYAHMDHLPPMTENEDQMLECTVSERLPNSRLSCQILLTDELKGLRVRIPEGTL